MGWVIFVAGAVLSWGAYGAFLYLGQTQLGNPLKAMLCVGVAHAEPSSVLPSGAVRGGKGDRGPRAEFVRHRPVLTAGGLCIG